jgi:hypothetical protein
MATQNQSFFPAFGQILAHKTRWVFTTIGLVIGVASVTAMIVALAGCDQFSESDPYALKIPPEKLKKIEMLELKEAKAEDQVRPDVNDANSVPPKELTLSLEQCRALTLENNLDLKVQLINPIIAAESVSQEEARFEAAFTSNVNYVKTDTPTASFLDEISGSQTDYFGAGLGVQVPMQTGGTVRFNLSDNRLKTGSIYSVFEMPESARTPMRFASLNMSGRSPTPEPSWR